jgi:hypothetical protein
MTGSLTYPKIDKSVRQTLGLSTTACASRRTNFEESYYWVSKVKYHSCSLVTDVASFEGFFPHHIVKLFVGICVELSYTSTQSKSIIGVIRSKII